MRKEERVERSSYGLFLKYSKAGPRETINKSGIEYTYFINILLANFYLCELDPCILRHIILIVILGLEMSTKNT
jgi:hypothetical protein